MRDGALLRTEVNPAEVKRVFLKDPSFHNTIIQFDFRLSGQTTDLRLVTGSGGGYNSVTEIYPSHFQVNTPVDRDAGIVPAHLGECVRKPCPDQWQTMTVEYWNDEIVAHLSDSEFVLGTHPIIDRTRTYFAFQFDLPGASIDNIRVWKATSQREDWAAARKKRTQVQAERVAVQRDAAERYKLVYTNVKSRLTLSDQTYRDLVARHDQLQADLHADYPEAFASHKQLGKTIAKKKQHLKETAPEFKALETAVHKAGRAEDDYVLSTKPELAELKEDGIPRQRFVSELGQLRSQLEADGNEQLAALVAETARRQVVLEARFPEAFESVDAAVEQRNAKRKSLNSDAEFQSRNKAVVDAGQAVKEYEQKTHPNLAQLAVDARAREPHSSVVIGESLAKMKNPESIQLDSPFGIDFDKQGNMYIVELSGGRVHKFDTAGKLTTIAGDGSTGYSGDNGPAKDATFNGMHNVAVTPGGDLYIADSWNHCVRKIDGQSGIITTIAETGKPGFSGDGGPASEAAFNFVMCASLNSTNDKLYVADLKNRRIRMVDLKTGIVTTAAGNGQKGIPKDGGMATESPLVDPRAVAVDSKNNIYILERSGHALRRVDSDGKIRTVAGTGKAGDADGDALKAQLNSPKHLAIDLNHNVIIADDQNKRVRLYDPKESTISSILGSGVKKPQRGLLRPHGVCVHQDGSIYIVDTGHHRILHLRLN